MTGISLSGERGRFRDLQARLWAWAQKTFPVTSTSSIAHHLKEEAAELEEAISRYRGTPEGAEDVEMEAADNAILLMQLASSQGFELADAMQLHGSCEPFRSPSEGAAEVLRLAMEGSSEDLQVACAQMIATLDGLAGRRQFSLLGVVERKFAVLLTRKWGAPDANGVVRHLKNEAPVSIQGWDDSVVVVRTIQRWDDEEGA